MSPPDAARLVQVKGNQPARTPARRRPRRRDRSDPDLRNPRRNPRTASRASAPDAVRTGQPDHAANHRTRGDVSSPQAVSVQRDAAAGLTNTLATLVLRPVNDAWIGWKPRSRDTRREESVFYAELFQALRARCRVIEGLHSSRSARPGRTHRAAVRHPQGATITDFLGPDALRLAV